MDAEPIREPTESDLDAWAGSEAVIWMFHISHRRMGIRLWKRISNESLWLVISGCERMVGPFSWLGAKLKLVRDSTGRRLIDEGAGFELTCSVVVVVPGPAGDLPNPFDGFFARS